MAHDGDARPGPLVEVRLATPGDSHPIWLWRNDPATRAASEQTSPVDWDTHRAWFASSLEAADRHLLVGQVQGTAIGVLRYDDSHDGSWVVSINLAPQARGRGLAVPLLTSGAAWAKRRPEAPRELVARVRTDNVASARSFQGAGYLSGQRRMKARDGRGDWLRFGLVLLSD